MDQLIRFRKIIFFLLCLTPIVLRSNGLISNLLTFFLALIPIAIAALLFNLEVEDGVLVDLDSENPGKKVWYKKFGKFGEFIFFSALGLLVLQFTPMLFQITIFISVFIAGSLYIIL